MTRFLRYLWYIALIGGASGAGVYTYFYPDAMKSAFTGVSFYILALMSLAWIHALASDWRDTQTDQPRGPQWILKLLAPALLVTTLIFLTVPPQLRVLNDEAELLGVSRAMALTQRAEIHHAADWSGSAIESSRPGNIKRPLLFPFWVSLIHSATGYRPANIYALNFLAAAATFALIANLFLKRWGMPAALAAILLVAAQPIMSLCATSGGFELLQVPLILLALTSLHRYLSTRSEPALRALTMHLILLMHIRYEGFIYAGLVATYLFTFRLLKPADLRRSWIYPAALLFFLPIFWQRILIAPQMRGQLPPGESLLSLGHLAEHTQVFLNTLTRFDLYLPYASIINIAGIIALAALLAKTCITRQDAPKTTARSIHWAAITALLTTAYWGIMTSYWWAEATDAVCSRFYLIMSVGLSFLAAWGALTWLPRRHGPVLLTAAALALFGIYHPIAIKNTFFNDREGFARNNQIIMSYLPPADEKRTLVINQFPSRYINYGYASTSTTRAKTSSTHVLDAIRQGTYASAFVIQELDAKTLEPRALRDHISDDYQLTTVFQAPSRSDAILRISRVDAPKPPTLAQH